MHYYQHHIGDFVRDTANLDDHQLATYLRLLWAYYDRETPIAGELEDIAFAMRSDEKTVRLLLRHYFTESPEGWRHARCDREIQAFHERQEKAQKSANVRWKNAGALRTHEGNAAVPPDANASKRIKTGGFDTPETCSKDASAMHPHSERNADARVSDANQEPITNNQDIAVTQETNTVRGKPLDCPHQAVIDAYHEILPANPRVMSWNKSRRGYLRQRWLEQSRPSETSRGFDSQEGGIAWFRRYFAHVAKSDFLTGRTKAREGREPFVASLEWLLLPANFANVLEGKYHGGVKQ